MENPTAFLMVGPPGAGKTTYARRLAAERGATIIEGDEIRSRIGKELNAPPMWTDLEDAIVERIAFLAPGSIILDGPHCDRFERRQATDLLRMHGYDVTAVVLQTPLDVCVMRNARRSRSVPRHAITRWENRLEKELSTIPNEDFKEVITVS